MIGLFEAEAERLLRGLDLVFKVEQRVFDKDHPEGF